MEHVRGWNIPFLMRMDIYQVTNKSNTFLISLAFLWIFKLDIFIGRKDLDITFGIGKVYISTGAGMH
jgi:hypothetical protein